MKHHLLFLLKALGLLIAIFLPIELFLFEKSAITENNSLDFKTYNIFWVLLIYLLIFIIIKVLKINLQAFGGLMFFGFFLYIGASLFSVLIFKKDYVLNVFKKKYYGTNLLNYQLGRDGDEQISSKVKYYVYLETQIINKESEIYSNGSERFLLWQAAVAAKYNPKYLEGFNKDRKTDNLELFLTIGPIMIIENIANILQPIFLIFFILVIGIFFKKHLFKNFVIELLKIK